MATRKLNADQSKSLSTLKKVLADKSSTDTQVKDSYHAFVAIGGHPDDLSPSEVETLKAVTNK